MERLLDCLHVIGDEVCLLLQWSDLVVDLFECSGGRADIFGVVLSIVDDASEATEECMGRCCCYCRGCGGCEQQRCRKAEREVLDGLGEVSF